MIIILKSKTFKDYYGENPNEYDLKFVHHNIIVLDDSIVECKKIEDDFNNIYNFDKKAFLIYFSDTENYLKITKHINIHHLYKNKIYLRIRNTKEFQNIKQINKERNIKLILDLKDIKEIDIKDFDVVIQIDKVSELPIEKLNKLIRKYRIKEILLGQIPYLTNEYSYLYEVMSKMYDVDSSNKLQLEKINKITNDIYKVDEYIKIVNKFQEILNSMNINNQLDGFYKIFNYIAKNVNYDDEGVNTTIIENQNLIGPVFNKKSVCEGYSKYLQQMLSLIGINSIVVQGGGTKKDGGHVWNQVLINNKWYNADVTVASNSIHNNEEVKTCLVNDDSLLYKTNMSISYKCNDNFEKKEKHNI